MSLCWSGLWGATLRPTSTFLPRWGVGGGQSCGCGRGGAREIPGSDATMATVATSSVPSMAIDAGSWWPRVTHPPAHPGWGISPFPAFPNPFATVPWGIPGCGVTPGPGGRSHAVPGPCQAWLDGEPSVLNHRCGREGGVSRPHAGARPSSQMRRLAPRSSHSHLPGIKPGPAAARAHLGQPVLQVSGPAAPRDGGLRPGALCSHARLCHDLRGRRGRVPAAPPPHPGAPSSPSSRG